MRQTIGICVSHVGSIFLRETVMEVSPARCWWQEAAVLLVKHL